MRFSLVLAAAAVALMAPAVSAKKMLDPHGIFCGQTLCYDVLQVEKGANDSEIKKNYRRLARSLHPDKNPDKDAKAKFNAVSKAYQVLSNEEERAKYDSYLQDPTEYIKKYGHHFFKTQAAPTDVTIVIVLILAIFSGIHYAVLVHQRETYFKMLVAVVVEDKPLSSGGTEETQALHKAAKDKFLAAKGDASKKAPKKGSGYKKEAAFKTAVEEVCAELTGSDDPNLATPTVWDTFVISVSKALFTELMLKVSGPTTDDQKELVISRLLGDDVFYDLKADELKELMERECWKADKMEEWKKENGLSDKKED